MSSPESDRRLPGLRAALDDDHIRRAFAGCENLTAEFSDLAETEIRHELIKYVPGKRGVVAYYVKESESSEAQRWIGKVYRKDRGALIFQHLQSLWHIGVEQSAPGAGLGMPRPLAFIHDLGMLLQEAVPGRPLSEFSTECDLLAAMHLTGANLARLHGLAVSFGETRTLDHHLSKYCHPGPQALMEAQPKLAPMVSEVIDGIRHEESHYDCATCAVHGDVNLTQVFVTPERAFFIDFDGFCRAHAALDVGNFIVTLKVRFVQESGILVQAFLDSYLDRAPAAGIVDLHAYQAFAYLRRAMICFRSRANEGWLPQARHLLEQALAALKGEEA